MIEFSNCISKAVVTGQGSNGCARRHNPRWHYPAASLAIHLIQSATYRESTWTGGSRSSTLAGQHIVHEHVLVGRGERSSTLAGQPIVQENLGGS